MKTTLFLLTILLIPCILAPVYAAAENETEIAWYRADFPPVSIPAGKHADEGFFDKTMHLLIEQLPEYSHQFRTANFKRIMLEIGENKNVCCPSLYKTKEREQFVAFSLPAMVVLPNGIISSEKNRSKLSSHLDAEGKLSLQSLLEDKSIKLGISNGRLYSGGIDQILDQFEGQNNILVHSGNDVFRGLINMMHLGRIDCLIGYPVEAGYFARENEKLNDYVYYPIKESSVPFTVGYIGCPDTEWGHNTIQKIDKIVAQHRTEKFITFYGEWLDDATRIVHKHMAQEYFTTQEKKEKSSQQ